jgi:citrate lyase beta subunit
MQIFQLIPLRKPKTIGRLISPFRNTGNVAVFDLEDSFWVPGSPRESGEMKSRAREQATRFCVEKESHQEGLRFGVRVNPAGTDCFYLDLEVVKALRDSVGLQVLILPKVESAGELESCRAALAKAGIPDVEVIPIVESRVAFDQIDLILAACLPAGVRRVIYGHHDYSLDAGHWPVSRTDSFEYWELVGFILGKIEEAGLNYIHPPVPDLTGVTRLRDCLNRLRALASRDLSILSAGPSQTSILVSLLQEASTTCGVFPSLQKCLLTEKEKRRLASELKDLFESNKRPEFSFAADARTGKFISPHEYLGALQYLGASEGPHL